MEEITRQEIREVLEDALKRASIPFTELQLETMAGGYFPPGMDQVHDMAGDNCILRMDRTGLLPSSGEINMAAEINHRRGAGAGKDRDSYVLGWQHCILYLMDKHGFEHQ